MAIGNPKIPTSGIARTEKATQCSGAMYDVGLQTIRIAATLTVGTNHAATTVATARELASPDRTSAVPTQPTEIAFAANRVMISGGIQRPISCNDSIIDCHSD